MSVNKEFNKFFIEDSTLYKSPVAQAQHYYEAGQRQGMERADELICGLIKTGPRQGNGCDDTAQRNGVVLASNTIRKEITNE